MRLYECTYEIRVKSENFTFDGTYLSFFFFFNRNFLVKSRIKKKNNNNDIIFDDTYQYRVRHTFVEYDSLPN